MHRDLFRDTAEGYRPSINTLVDTFRPMILFATPRNAMWSALVERVQQRAGHIEIVHESVEVLDPRRLPDVEAVVTLGLNERTPARMPNLRLVLVPMAGLNTLPVEALRSRGVTVVNSHANARWVAERVLAMLLSFRGRIARFDRDLRGGRWHGFTAAEPPSESWCSIHGSTIAVIGTGSIGRWVARVTAPFDVECRGVRRRQKTDDLPTGLFESIHTDLRSAVEGADTVVCTLPLTDETRDTIGTEELEAMRGAFLINVGRGPVVSEQALYEALRTNVLAGAAVDTWYRYPDPPGSEQFPSRYPFNELDNIVLSPHVAGYTIEAARASARDVAERLIEWIEAGTPAAFPHAADLSTGY